MPYFQPDGAGRTRREEDEVEQPGGPTAGVAAPYAATPGGAGALAAPVAGGSAPQQHGGGSGQFVNFDTYFSANAPGAQGMAQQVGQSVGQAAQGAQSAVQQQESAWKGQVDAGVNYGGGGQRAAYTGPQQFEASADTLSATDRAQSQLQATQDGYGIQSLVEQQFGSNPAGGGYSEGMSAFDAALTQSAGAGDFAALRDQYAGLDGALDAARGRANEYAGYAQQDVAGINAGLDAQSAAAAESAAARAAREAEMDRLKQAADQNRRLQGQQRNYLEGFGTLDDRWDNIRDLWDDGGVSTLYEQGEKTKDEQKLLEKLILDAQRRGDEDP